MVPPTVIAQQLIDWTDCSRVVSARLAAEADETRVIEQKYHPEIAIDLCKEAIKEPARKHKTLLFKFAEFA